MERVGLRQLRQNACEILRRVEAGEEIEVTVQGRPAAALVPFPGPWRRERALSGTEIMRRPEGMPEESTGWAEAHGNRPYDDGAFRDPWERR